MPQASTEALKAFNQALGRCAKEIDERQIQLDLARVYQLVQDNKEAASLSTELKCILAQHQPNYLKVAAFVAVSYQIAFHDDALVTQVKNSADTLMTQGYDGFKAGFAVHQILEELTVLHHSDLHVEYGGPTFHLVDEYIDWRETQPTAIAVRPTKAELELHSRKAAQKWWQETGKTEALCDTCGKPMQCDEGYLISGRRHRMFMAGNEYVFNLGEELICETCSKDILSL